MTLLSKIQKFIVETKIRTRCINRTLIDEFPGILEDISFWGSKRKSDQSFEYFLKNEKKLSKGALKKAFSSSDMHKLKQVTFEGLDVSFCCSLLPLICEGIEINSSTTNEARIECQLNKLKKLRNQVMHEPEGGAVNPSIAIEIEAVAKKLLDIAGAMYSREEDEVTSAKVKAKQIINDAKDMVNNRVITAHNIMLND